MKSIIFTCLLVVGFSYSFVIESDHDQPQVTIKTGQLKGKTVTFRGIKVNRFLGIPFGEPLSGLSRFQKPKPVQPWDGVLPAYEYGPMCTQPQVPLSGPKLTEDCFYLNIFETWVALNDFENNATNKLRPVMVWIHGGGFTHGSADMFGGYDGTILAALHDVIVVSINYRLNQFGFLYLPEHGIPGNMGLWDQRLALEWVQSNIKYFGGDSDKVTIFGESAGSMSISTHLVSPHSKGLFKGVIMQSGAFYDSSLTQTTRMPISFLEALNCTLPEEIQSCLSSYEFGENPLADSMVSTPVIGDEFLPDSPENIISQHGVDSNIHVLLGTVGNEGASLILATDPHFFDLFHPTNFTMESVKRILSDQLSFISNGKDAVDYIVKNYFTNFTDSDDEMRLLVTKAFGDILISCPTYMFGRGLVKNGHSGVFAYYQTQKSLISFLPFIVNSTLLPATHGDDIPFVFGYSMKENETFDREETILSNIMMQAWTNFAKHGEPGSIGGQRWSPWKEDGKNFLNPTIELNSKRIGHYESFQVDSCFENWPFGMNVKKN